MKAKKEVKYLVIKLEDLDDYFNDFTHGLFTTDEEKKVINKEPFFKVINKLQKQYKNKYIIINQDEPYAEVVWQIVLNGEDMKKEIETILFSDRMKMEKEFFKWAKKTKAVIIPRNIIAWLQTRYDFVKKE